MNTEQLAARTVGDVVSEDFRLGAVFKHYGIDFCCGGGRTVETACRARKVDVEDLARALDEASTAEPGRVPAGASRWSAEFLTGYILNEHHTYVRSRIPVLREFTAKVAKVHGHHYTELAAIRDTFDRLATELEQHMTTEEDRLFPAILAAPAQQESRTEILAQLEHEHEAAGAAMAELRQLTNGFVPPEGACNTFRAAYAGLADFEADLHAHVHLENNVLFPKVIKAWSPSDHDDPEPPNAHSPDDRARPAGSRW